MKKQKTHTDRKHERALQRKQERQQNREQGNVSKQMPADIPLLNIRVACSAVLALLAIAVALKAYETPVPSADQRAVINLSAVGIDDANIFFTYAKNVAAGQGAVYYPGGEPVEGYSSTLFLLLCSVGMLVTENIEFFVLLVNAIFMCGVLIALQVFLHGMAKESLPEGTPISKRELLIVNWAASILLWAWVILSPAYVIWTTVTLMDVGLWSFVFVSGSLAAVSKALKPESSSRVLNLWIVLMVLTRSEAFYLCLVWLMAIVIARVKQNRSVTGAMKSIKGSFLCYLAAVAVITTGRYLYFGHPLPNTYYAKVSTDFFYNLKLGVGYLIEFIKAEPWTGAALLMNFVVLFKSLRVSWHSEEGGCNTGQQAIALVSLITLLAALAPILTGGDHFNYFRFFQPYWPLLALACLYYLRKYFLIESLPTMRKPLRVGFSSIALMGTMLLLQAPPWTIILQSHGRAEPTLANEFQLALGGRQLGIMLNQWNLELQEEPQVNIETLSLGTLTTGGIGYTYDGPVLDMLGLNNVRMAHSQGDRKGNKNHAAFNKDVFFELAPDLFAPRSSLNNASEIASRAEVFPFGQGRGFWDTALKGLGTDKRFLEAYIPVELVRSTDKGILRQRCTVWVRKTLLPKIDKKTTHFTITAIQ